MSASLYAGHVQTSLFQKAMLAAGSGIACYINPYRGDMVAVNGETSGYYALKCMHKKMSQNETGQFILQNKPRLNSSTINLNKLRTLDKNTFGRQYVDMLDKYNITPDSRLPVRFVDDAELAYVMQRYREVHDLMHLLLDQPTNLHGEIIVKWFEAIQTGLPMCTIGALMSPFKLNSKQKSKFRSRTLPWVIRTGYNANFYLNFVYEDFFTSDISDVRDKLNIKILEKTTKSSKKEKNS